MPLLALMCLYAAAQPVTNPLAAGYLPLGTYSKKWVDVYAARSNAASLASLQQSSVALYTERRFALSNLNSFSFSGGVVTKAGAFAVQGNYFGISQFAHSQLALAYGMRVSKKVDVGVQFNYYNLHQGAGYGSASNINAAAGAILHLTDKVHVGIHIYNPVGSKWSKAEEKIPSQYTLGLGYEASDKLFVSAEAVKEENLPASINAGLQYQFNKSFFARAGVRTATSCYYAAVGFVLDAFRVDVAASYQAPLGVSPGILVLFNIGKKKPETAKQNTEP